MIYSCCWLADSNIPLAMMLVVMSHVVLLSKLLHRSYVFEAISLRSDSARVVLCWIRLIVLWLCSGISLRALTSGWLCCQLSIAWATRMRFHLEIVNRSYAVIATLPNIWLSYWWVGVSIVGIRSTVADSLVSSLRGCLELIEIGRLSAYLGHLDFISTPVGWTNG